MPALSCFTHAEEREIALKIARGEKTRVQLAGELQVHRNTISNICARHPDVFREEQAKDKAPGSVKHGD